MPFLSKLIVSTPVNFVSALLNLPVGAAPSALNFLMHMDNANAPVLYEFDSNGFIRAAPDRLVSPEEQLWIDKTNADHQALGEADRRALDNFLKELFPLSEGGVFESKKLLSPFLINNPDPLIKDIKYFPWVDPLVLDLDGDGLEISPLSAGVQFDTNADTIRTATAWVGADDGLLVLDRNGNGQIDSARELFGDETLLADGKKAAHGFAALADLDVGGAVGATGGAGDGVFDAKDAQFGAVRIWRDLNQDGISQAGELQTMAEAGIASIGLASTATETSYGDAQLVQSGSFVRTDGSEGQAGSFVLAVDNAVATHPPIAVSAEAAALPQVQGSGWVRGLQEAATLNPQLLGLYGQSESAGNRAGFTGSMGDLLLEWGNESDDMRTSKQSGTRVCITLSTKHGMRKRGRLLRRKFWEQNRANI